MNPGFGIILWIVIGGLAGWIASKLMGTDARMGALANIVVGIVGALLGGFITTRVFGDNLGNNGYIASFLVALLGASVLLGIARLFSGRRVRTV